MDTRCHHFPQSSDFLWLDLTQRGCATFWTTGEQIVPAILFSHFLKSRLNLFFRIRAPVRTLTTELQARPRPRRKGPRRSRKRRRAKSPSRTRPATTRPLQVRNPNPPRRPSRHPRRKRHSPPRRPPSLGKFLTCFTKHPTSGG